MAEFSNPNQQGGQDNRSLIAMMVLLVAVFFGLQFYKAKTNPQTASPSTPGITTPGAVSHGAANNGAGVPAQTAGMNAGTGGNAPGATSGVAAAVPAMQASAETDSVIENELYRIEFSNRGAQVKSWILKRYKDSDGKPLDLVHGQAAKLVGYPMSVYTYDGLSAPVAAASRSGNVVSLTLTTPMPAEINGRTVSVSGIADNSFNGTFAVNQTGPNTVSYAQDRGQREQHGRNGCDGEWRDRREA